MKRPDCICPHPDARRCLEIRTPMGRVPKGERCECGCHSGDEDGKTGWDDDDMDEWEAWPRCGCPYCHCSTRTEFGGPCENCVNHAHQG